MNGAGMVRQKPIALVVFLENVGHITGLHLPQWAMNTIDFVTEEYAKTLLTLYGARRHYDRVIVLEDACATGPHLSNALLSASRTHTVDVLLLVHGRDGQLIGHKGTHTVGRETFDYLRQCRHDDPASLDLRVVYGLNCYGLSLAPVWHALGAKAVNGSPGINWFPEPSLSVFLRSWLNGQPYSEAVAASNAAANRWWSKILSNKSDTANQAHPWIESSRQVVFGERDIRIDS